MELGTPEVCSALGQMTYKCGRYHVADTGLWFGARPWFPRAEGGRLRVPCRGLSRGATSPLACPVRRKFLSVFLRARLGLRVSLGESPRSESLALCRPQAAGGVGRSGDRRTVGGAGSPEAARAGGAVPGARTQQQDARRLFAPDHKLVVTQSLLGAEAAGSRSVFPTSVRGCAGATRD